MYSTRRTPASSLLVAIIVPTRIEDWKRLNWIQFKTVNSVVVVVQYPTWIWHCNQDSYWCAAEILTDLDKECDLLAITSSRPSQLCFKKEVLQEGFFAVSHMIQSSIKYSISQSTVYYEYSTEVYNICRTELQTIQYMYKSCPSNERGIVMFFLRIEQHSTGVQPILY